MKKHPVRLLAVSGPGAGLKLDFFRRVTLGRDDTCQLLVPDPAMSRRHVELKWENGRVLVHDLDSANGTWINDQRIRSAVLHSGEQFRAGETTFCVEFDQPQFAPPKFAAAPVTKATGRRGPLWAATLLALIISIVVVTATWWLFFRPKIQTVNETTIPKMFPSPRVSGERVRVGGQLDGIVPAEQSTKRIEPEDQTAQGLDQSPHYEEQFVFKGSITEKVPYRAYRIPSIARAPNGNLVVMCEGRVDGPDCSRIDIVSKVSQDNGKTWGKERVIINGPYKTYGDPTQLVDRLTGRMWVFFSAIPDCSPAVMVPTNPNRYHLASMISDDNGLTYHSYHEYNDIMPADGSDAFGRVGTGIQVRYGPTKGRLVVLSRKRLVYSDDHGQTWFAIKKVRGTGEGNILDRSNGDFVKNDRPVRAGGRAQSLSTDQMKTWSQWEANRDLPDANCQGTLIRYTSEASGRIRWAFLNAPFTRNSHTLRLSYDEGKTWPISRELKPDSPRPIINRNDIPSAGYSSMTHTADNQFGILVEQNANGGARSLLFVKVNLPWILNGNKEP